jgi:hypothetical protein
MIRGLKPCVRAALAAAAFATATHALAAARVYVNARFGYSIAYPPQLVPEPESDSGDGRAFHAIGGPTRALVWASYNSSGDTPALLEAEAARDCSGPPTYRRIKASFFALSCVSGADIVYQKTLFAGDTETSFRITYPAEQRARWDRVTAQMSASLSPSVR